MRGASFKMILPGVIEEVANMPRPLLGDVLISYNLGDSVSRVARTEVRLEMLETLLGVLDKLKEISSKGSSTSFSGRIFIVLS